MKEFIKALEDKGIMEGIIESHIFAQSLVKHPIDKGGLEMILNLEMADDEELSDLFDEEACNLATDAVFKYVQEKVLEKEAEKALDDVDVDGLFEKATCEKKTVKFDESLHDALSKIFEAILDDLK